MNIKELYSLYLKVTTLIAEYECNNPDDECYMVYESEAINLYHKILHGNASRKDFLISAIKGKLYYLDCRNIKCYSTLMIKFNRLYRKQQN